MSQRVSFSASVVFMLAIFVLVACGGTPPTEAPAATEPPAAATGPAATEPSVPATEPPATEAPATEAPTSTAVQPVAWIDSITYDPAYPEKDGVVTFIINYRNRSSDEVLKVVKLEITYGEYLMYCPPGVTSTSGETCQSDPEPVDNSPDSHYLRYELGELDFEATGAVIISFTVGEIPPEVSLSATLSGETFTDRRQIVIYPEQGLLEVYSEGVTVWLPRQDSEKIIHSERREFDFDPMTIPVAESEKYSIIRPLIYLDIVDQSQEIVNDFSPSITLTANYTADDAKDAGTASDLVLLIYEEGRWIACDEFIETDKTLCSVTDKNQSSEDGGYVTINITKWTSGAGWGKRIAPQ